MDVSHVTCHGAVVASAPRFVPSNWNCTPITPTLSAALAVTITDPATVAPEVGNVMATVGGVTSRISTAVFRGF